MRIDGTLTKWNDDRGFGFITPAQGGLEIFAHISAFPKDGQRPHPGDRVTFEIGTGKDGKKQARNILCPARKTETPYRLSMPARRDDSPGLLRRLVPLLLVVGLGAFAYTKYTDDSISQAADGAASLSAGDVPSGVAAAGTPSFRCDGRTHCSQMTSCAEAEFFLRNCPGVEMDGNNDGEPCERQWCNRPFAP